MITRRDFGKAALIAAPAASLLAKPNSKFHGVQIGAITYSFRTLPSTADDILKYCVELGLSSIELMGDVAENFAGAPAAPRGGGRQPTPEQREAMKKAAADRMKWRTSASMDKFKELRKKYNDAGVNIAILKLGISDAMGGDECDYVFQAAKAVGATCITMELPRGPELSKKAGEFADKHKIYVGYHNHTQVNESSWETALGQARYNSINLDVGHFTEAISKSPVPFIQKNHSRITSFHLKDKKFGTNGGGNAVWGTAETPLKEVLQLMKKEKYSWPANIELEYSIPESSTVMAEMAKCVKFCKDALA
ncbi:MAG: sugar phosphate isomerase/epimerase [Acidobacteria bacterium]|nr:sugar phosphate isomerase/epimerase [Acidobacteriota bacterium]